MCAAGPPPPPPPGRLQRKVLSYSFLGLLLLGVGWTLYRMVQPFLVPVVVAAVFSALFYPWYERAARLFGGRRTLASLVCCLVLLTALLVPAYFVAALLAREAAGLYTLAADQVQLLLRTDPAEVKAQLGRLALARALHLDRLDWEARLLELTRSLGGILAGVVTDTSRGTIQLVGNLFITFFTLFYFFIDGPRLVSYLKYLCPLEERFESQLIARFVSVARASVKGSLLIGLLQGTLGGLILWAFGFPSPVLWGAVMVLLSLVPLVGSWLVLYPAGIYSLATGHLWSGLAIIGLCTVVVSQIDNLLRPRLVGRDAGLHDLVIFFSTLGGIRVFGVMGFLIGPVIAALFLTLLDFYSTEFGEHLGAAEALPSPVPPATDNATARLDP
jgi:predicted PurR-regulated permease PerM